MQHSFYEIVKNLPLRFRDNTKFVDASLLFVDNSQEGGCPGVPVHEGIPFVFITIHGVMTQFVNVSFLCVPVHEDTTARKCT